MLLRRSLTFGRQYAANKKGRFFSLDKNSSKFRKWHRCNLKRNTSVLVAARESSTNSAFNSVKILGVGALLLNIFDDGRINNEKNLRNGNESKVLFLISAVLIEGIRCRTNPWPLKHNRADVGKNPICI